MALQRVDVFGKVFDLFGRETFCVAVLVVAVVLGDDILDGDGTSVIHIGSGAPDFNQNRRTEGAVAIIVCSQSKNIFLFVAIIGGCMAFDAFGFAFKDNLAAKC